MGLIQDLIKRAIAKKKNKTITESEFNEYIETEHQRMRASDMMQIEKERFSSWN